MMAGLILTVIGSGIVLIRAFQVPGYWIPLLIGVALLLIGAIRRVRPGGS